MEVKTPTKFLRSYNRTPESAAKIEAIQAKKLQNKDREILLLKEETEKIEKEINDTHEKCNQVKSQRFQMKSISRIEIQNMEGDLKREITIIKEAAKMKAEQMCAENEANKTKLVSQMKELIYSTSDECNKIASGISVTKESNKAVILQFHALVHNHVSVIQAPREPTELEQANIELSSTLNNLNQSIGLFTYEPKKSLEISEISVFESEYDEDYATPHPKPILSYQPYIVLQPRFLS